MIADMQLRQIIRGRLRRGRALAFGLAACVLLAAPAATADQLLVGGMTWMNAFPSTWNAMAPKLVSDGLNSYAVLCGFSGSQNLCSVVRRRGVEMWEQGARTFVASQPPVMVIDRKGRLNIFFNNPALHHLRFDHPAIDLIHSVDMPLQFSGDTGYLHASYDASTDTMLLAFNETSTWQLYFTVKYADNDWVPPGPLPAAAPGTLMLYARTLRASGRYYVLAGEHPLGSPNANYTAALLYESPSPTGPWSTRTLHRSTGMNLGVPYQNWVYPLDLQANAAGRLRATMQIAEPGSGHPPLPEGMYVAREEDGFALRLVGNGIDDGFGLHVDPSGAHFAFALRLSDSAYTHAGHLVSFRSDDDGATWQPAALLVSGDALNPVTLDPRNGSMSGGKEISYIYSASLSPPFDRVLSSEIPLALANTANRYDYSSTGADGAVDYVRAFADPATARSYYYGYDRRADGSFTLTYVYYGGDFYQVYVFESRGAYRFYNSDGYSVTYERPEEIFYWFTDDDGSLDHIYIYRDRSLDIYWWQIVDYDVSGTNWTATYVYYRGSYWRIEITDSAGHFTRQDSTGLYESG